jgi:hypothetical protein
MTQERSIPVRRRIKIGLPSVTWKPAKALSFLAVSASSPIEIQVSVTTMSASLSASAGDAVKTTDEACPNSVLEDRNHATGACQYAQFVRLLKLA